mgnify:FL=1
MGVDSITNFATPKSRYHDQDSFNRQVAHHFNLLMQGKSNNVINVTLTNSSTTTTVTSALIGVNTVAMCIPTNAAGAAITAPYRDLDSSVNGSMSLIHASDANSKKFRVVLIG